MSELILKPCPPEFCSGRQDWINQACRELGLGPGHPIILRNSDDGLCYCICGGSDSDKAEARTAKE